MYILKKEQVHCAKTATIPLLRAAHFSLEKPETLLQAIDIHAVSSQELCEWITNLQHILAEGHEMGAVKVFDWFLVKVNAEVGGV